MLIFLMKNLTIKATPNPQKKKKPHRTLSLEELYLEKAEKERKDVSNHDLEGKCGPLKQGHPHRSLHVLIAEGANFSVFLSRH